MRTHAAVEADGLKEHSKNDEEIHKYLVTNAQQDVGLDPDIALCDSEEHPPLLRLF